MNIVNSTQISKDIVMGLCTAGKNLLAIIHFDYFYIFKVWFYFLKSDIYFEKVFILNIISIIIFVILPC